jgi:hypothetical protein
LQTLQRFDHAQHISFAGWFPALRQSGLGPSP